VSSLVKLTRPRRRTRWHSGPTRLSIAALLLLSVACLAGCGGSGASQETREAQFLRSLLPAGAFLDNCTSELRACVAPAHEITGLSASASAQTVALEYGDGHVEVWSAKPRRRLLSTTAIDTSTGTLEATMSPDGSYLAITDKGLSGSRSTIWVLPPIVTAPISVPVSSSDISSVGFGPEAFVMTATAPSGERDLVYAATPTARPSRVITQTAAYPPPVQNSLGSPIYDPGARQFVFGASLSAPKPTDKYYTDNGFTTWRPGEPAVATDPGDCLTTAFSEDGSTFACESFPATSTPFPVLKLWDVRARRQLTQWMPESPLERKPPQYLSLAFIHDGRELAALESGTHGNANAERVVVFRLSDHKIVRTYTLPAAGFAQLFSVGDVLLVKETLREVMKKERLPGSGGVHEVPVGRIERWVALTP
jgi:hypothetical protein